MGVDQRAGQYWFHNGGEVKHARTIAKMPEANKLDRDESANLSVTLWDLHVPREDEDVFREEGRGKSQMTTFRTRSPCHGKSI